MKCMSKILFIVGWVVSACSAAVGEMDTPETNTADQADSGVRFELSAEYPIAVLSGYEDVVIAYFAAVNGDAEAQFQIGSLLDAGDRVPRDDVRAAYWYWRAAEQGHVKSEINLGVKYLRGDGVFRDAYEAFRLLRSAATKGHAVAQHNLGLMYYYGEGVEQTDLVQAHAWLSMAAESRPQPAAQIRDRIALEMTADQLADADVLFQEYLKTYGP